MAKVAQFIGCTIDWLYVKPVQKVISKETFRYAACGGINMLLDMLIYAFLYNVVVAKSNVDLGVVVISPHIMALILVFPITFFNGFWLNRNVAFVRSTLTQRTQLVRYVFSVGGSLLLNYLLMKLLVESLYLWPTPSKLVTTLISVVYSYLMARFYTFKR